MKIEIQGRRWTSQGNGQTHHGVKCYVDGENVFTSENFESGDQYIETGLRELVKLGILTKEEVEKSDKWELQEKSIPHESTGFNKDLEKSRAKKIIKTLTKYHLVG